jgi:hypothetical protein
VVLPPWEATYNLAQSTINFPANFTGYFNVSLAARFGLNMFDQSNGQLEWSSNVHHYNATNDMEAFLFRQIASVKALNPETKNFIYRSGQCALSYVQVFRDAINDPTKHNYWMQVSSSGEILVFSFVSSRSSTHFPSPPPIAAALLYIMCTIVPHWSQQRHDLL